MKDISCKIIEDLLPLYHDNVCSDDSHRLVEEHLNSCAKCQELLNTMKSEVDLPLAMNDAATIKGIAKKWKADKLTAFLRGGCFVSFLASAACFIMFSINGSYIAPDGTLIESFVYIPIGFLFAFMAAGFGLVLAIRSLIRRFTFNRKKKTAYK